MEAKKIKITYLYNSGFAVEVDKHLIIFDYCMLTSKNSERNLRGGVVGFEDMSSKSYVTILVSHGHKDHFNAAILRFKRKIKNITYVFSDDINEKNAAILIKEGESVKINGITVKAFPSTDIGVSYCVKIDGITIFHAGDLNLWASNEEEPVHYRKSRMAYSKALSKIVLDEKINIAFFPLDPRIGEGYDVGAKLFIDKFKPDIFVPMHFARRYDVCKKLYNEMKGKIYIWNIKDRGQQVECIFEQTKVIVNEVV